MADWRTTVLDDPSQWPKGTRVPLEAAHVDPRGGIQCLVNFPCKNVSVITSRKHTLRSNHYHKSDWHYMYVLKGSFEYHYRPAGSKETAKKLIVRAGEMVFTPPLEEHATVFLEDCELLAISRNPRDQATYEADTVRIELLDPAAYR
jgi:dTDP-4-dehydrorhamnose 3,5-epimerase-like enzyme